ncbi:hypothetical protein CPB83DRAFT_859956 [Crepidotus variabilis]|uniref:Uncharacterized protein n=1 Tax=Crepidotus variabilis TaxID=179855 RepID=A0A9P6E9Z6_9AGAR|nr:hypothetical protein CPB83DRAFT_859956 [Crepidotus variabilis]
MTRWALGVITSRNYEIGWRSSVSNIQNRDTVNDSDNVSQMNVPGVRVFIALNLIGATGLFIVMMTALFSVSVKRLSTWYSFCTSWIISCVSYSLLTFARQQSTQAPDFALCFIQTALIYSVPPLTSCTTLSLVVQILLNFSASLADVPSTTGINTFATLLIGPYIIFVIIFIGVCVYGAQNPITVVKAERGTYCHSTDGSWQKVSFGFVIAVSLVIVVIQAYLARRLYQNRKIMEWKSTTIAMTLRGLLFSLIGLITVMAAMAFIITSSHNLNFDIILAMLPVLAFVVFGTQNDLLMVWFRSCLLAG